MGQSAGDDRPRPRSPEPHGGSGASERERAESLIPDVLEPGEEDRSRPGGGVPFGGGPGGMFESRSFGGGRVQVYGCSPGCIILSIVISVALSVILTLLLNLIF